MSVNYVTLSLRKSGVSEKLFYDPYVAVPHTTIDWVSLKPEGQPFGLLMKRGNLAIAFPALFLEAETRTIVVKLANSIALTELQLATIQSQWLYNGDAAGNPIYEIPLTQLLFHANDYTEDEIRYQWGVDIADLSTVQTAAILKKAVMLLGLITELAQLLVAMGVLAPGYALIIRSVAEVLRRLATIEEDDIERFLDAITKGVVLQRPWSEIASMFHFSDIPSSGFLNATALLGDAEMLRAVVDKIVSRARVSYQTPGGLFIDRIVRKLSGDSPIPYNPGSNTVPEKREEEKKDTEDTKPPGNAPVGDIIIRLPGEK